jgi:hypothetical protein
MGGLNCPVDTLRTIAGQFEDSLCGLLNNFKEFVTLSSSVLHDRDIDRDITEKQTQSRQIGRCVC